MSKDHVHLFVSCPPHISPNYLMQRIKGKSSRKLLQEFSHLNKTQGRAPVGPGILRGEFGSDYGRGDHRVHTQTQDITNEDSDFQVEANRSSGPVELQPICRTRSFQLIGGVRL